MRSLFLALALIPLLSACGSQSAHTTGGANAAAERDNPGRYIQVNYEVRRNLVGKKVVEGEVINTAKFQKWNTVTLRITSYKDGDDHSVNYTVSKALAPGEKADFKFKPEGNPERVTVAVAGATAD